MNRNDYLRTFIAILLPYEVTHFLTLMQNDLKKARIRASFPKPETMHLTLKFIGDTASGQIREIQECMMAVSLQDTAPLVLRAYKSDMVWDTGADRYFRADRGCAEQRTASPDWP